MSAKECTHCKRLLPFSKFRKDLRRLSGITTVCNECGNRRSREWRARNPAPAKEYTKLATVRRKSSIQHYANSLYKFILARTKRDPRYMKREVKFDRATFLAWLLNQEKFHLLFNAWSSAGHPRKLSPSIDRVDNTKGYSMDNIEVVTVSENSIRKHISQGHKISPSFRRREGGA